MKTHPHPSSSPAAAPSEAAIRDHAYHLYEQSGYAQGRDLDHWHEASAWLRDQALASATVAASEAAPRFGVPEPGHVHAATGHARTVLESTAHTSSRRHS